MAGKSPEESIVAHIDDDLTDLEAHGTPPLPPAATTGYADNEGARIWYASFGDGPPVVLLHGGLGNAGNFGYQVPALLDAGYRVIAVDSRGQGRSTRDEQRYTYQLMASDTRAVMDALGIAKAAIVGWSDGAATGIVMAKETPERVTGVFFFACCIDETGLHPFRLTPVIERIYNHHVREYAALSPVVGGFEKMRDDLGPMQQGEPNYSAAEMGTIHVPVWSVVGENDEFIKAEHAEYIARSIPGARFMLLPGVSHFAPMQRPELFNDTVLEFLATIT